MLCGLRSACPYRERGNQLGFRVNRNPRPHVTIAKRAALIGGDILIFRVAKAPDFIALDLFASQIAKRLILIIGAGSANFRHHLQHSIKGHSAHAGRGAK
jgi:hypothetical protein